jgi:uncharacterized protein YndB with AHSA1/START domain
VADLTIQREVLIEAPVDVVWRTITEPVHITEWFADRVELDVRPGGTGTFVFDEHPRTELTEVAIAVEIVDPPVRFAFRWGHPDGAAAVPENSVLVQFTLTSEGSDRTRLRVVETGLERTGWPEDELVRYADDHREGWAHHLGRLEARFTRR